MAEIARTPASVAITGPGLLSRVYGLGSVFGKTLRDARWQVVALSLVVGALVLVTASQIAAQFGTIESRQELQSQMALLPPVFRALLGDPITVFTLPGFVSWRILGFMPLMLGVWSIVVLSGTIAGEASRGTLEVVLGTPVSRRRLALQKYAAHALAVAIVMATGALVTWLAGVAFGALPGDEVPIADAFGEFALVGLLALLAGSIAFALGPLVGRGPATGIAASAFFGAYIVKGYSALVPGFDVLQALSPFYWTVRHRPMAGVSDWPSMLALGGLIAALVVAGVLTFERRDLGATIRPRTVRGTGFLSRFRGWGLAGPASRSLAERLPSAIGWGATLGSYGLFIALSAESFTQMLTSIPQFAEIAAAFYPGIDFTTAGGIVQVAMFNFASLIVGLAAAELVSGWTSDEREQRLEMILAAPVARLSWALRSGVALMVAVVVLGAVAGAGTAIGSVLQGDDGLVPFAGVLTLSLYGAALAAVGVVVAGVGRPGWSAPVVAATAIAFYLLDLVGGALRLPAELLNVALVRHLGQPVAGLYNVPGMILSAAMAAGGLALGAWLFSRRDLRAK